MTNNVIFRIEGGFFHADLETIAQLCRDMQAYYKSRKGDYEVIVRHKGGEEGFWAQGWRVSTQTGEWRVIYSQGQEGAQQS